MFTGIKQLPSGYWAVWIDGNWVDAAILTQQEAARKLKEFMKTMK